MATREMSMSLAMRSCKDRQQPQRKKGRSFGKSTNLGLLRKGKHFEGYLCREIASTMCCESRRNAWMKGGPPQRDAVSTQPSDPAEKKDPRGRTPAEAPASLSNADTTNACKFQHRHFSFPNAPQRLILFARVVVFAVLSLNLHQPS